MTKLSKILVFFMLVAFVAAAALAGDTGDQKLTGKKAKEKTSAVTETASAKEIQWLSYDSGMAKAKAQNKSVVIDFYTTWCGWCKRMDATTFKDPGVIDAFNKNFVGVRVNGDATTAFVTLEGERMSEHQLTQTFAVRGYPTYWFLDSDGKKIGPAPGYKPADQFVSLLKYVGEGHYKTMSYDTFLKKESGKG
jgi:thioredoxin-related protein